MSKFDAYIKNISGSTGLSNISIIDGILDDENMLPIPNLGKHAFLIGASDPKHLWIWNEQKEGENKWEDQGAIASEVSKITTSISTIPWDNSPSFSTQFTTNNNIDCINFNLNIPERKPDSLKTISGNIISFTDGIEAPVGDLKVNIEPIQDLHGYDHPWPAGGGKNLFDVNKVTIGKTYTGTSNSSKATIKIKLPGEGERRFGLSLNGENVMDEILVCPYSNYPIGMSEYTGNKAVYQLSESFTHFCIEFTKDNISIEDIEALKIQFEYNESTTSYEPYSNICPISGWTGMNVVVSPTISAQDGTIYPISWQAEAGIVYGGSLDVTTGVLTVDRASVGLGTLDWNQNATYSSIYYATVSTIKQPAVSSDRNKGIISSIYKPSSATGINNNMDDYGMLKNGTAINIRNSSCSTVAEFVTASSGQTLVYELATPITYQLSPTEVTTLLGINNVWADTGDSKLIYFCNSDEGISAGTIIENINNKIDNKSDINHTHDNRYYLQSQIDTKFSEIERKTLHLSIQDVNNFPVIFTTTNITSKMRIMEMSFSNPNCININEIPWETSNGQLSLGQSDTISGTTNIEIDLIEI